MRTIKISEKTYGYQVQIGNEIIGANNLSILNIMSKYYGIKNPIFNPIFKDIQFDNKNSNFYVDSTSFLEQMILSITKSIKLHQFNVDIINKQIREHNKYLQSIGMNQIEQVVFKLKNELIEYIESYSDEGEQMNCKGYFYFEFAE